MSGLPGVFTAAELMARRFDPLPSLDAYRDARGRYHAWCDACQKWHVHSPGSPRNRPAHCRSRGSKHHPDGYHLNVVGTWPLEATKEAQG